MISCQRDISAPAAARCASFWEAKFSNDSESVTQARRSSAVRLASALAFGEGAASFGSEAKRSASVAAFVNTRRAASVGSFDVAAWTMLHAVAGRGPGSDARVARALPRRLWFRPSRCTRVGRHALRAAVLGPVLAEG